MLRITVEIVPHGIEEAKRTIGTLEVANISPSGEKCDYSYWLQENAGKTKKGNIKGHLRSAGFWVLIKRVLSDAV